MYYVEFKSHRGKVEQTEKFETLDELWDEIWTWDQRDEYYIARNENDSNYLDLVDGCNIEIVHESETQKIRDFLFDIHFYDYESAKIKKTKPD